MSVVQLVIFSLVCLFCFCLFITCTFTCMLCLLKGRWLTVLVLLVYMNIAGFYAECFDYAFISSTLSATNTTLRFYFCSLNLANYFLVIPMRKKPWGRHRPLLAPAQPCAGQQPLMSSRWPVCTGMWSHIYSLTTLYNCSGASSQ